MLLGLLQLQQPTSRNQTMALASFLSKIFNMVHERMREGRKEILETVNQLDCRF